MPYTGYSSTGQTAAPASTTGTPDSIDKPTSDPPTYDPNQVKAYNAAPGDQQNALPQDQQNLQALLNLLMPGLAANDAQSNAAISSILQQLGFSNQANALSAGQAQQGADFARQHLGVQEGQLGIETGANARQGALLPQLHDLVLQGFTQQEQQAWRNTQSQQQDLDSNLTSRGAYTSIGGNQQRGRIQQNLSDTLQTIGREREQSNLNFNEQVAQNSDAKKQLDLMQQNLGISGEEINSRLNNTLAQLGLSGQMTSAQLLGEIAKIQAGQYSPISQIIGDIYSISGLQVPAGTPVGG